LPASTQRASIVPRTRGVIGTDRAAARVLVPGTTIAVCPSSTIRMCSPTATKKLHPVVARHRELRLQRSRFLRTQNIRRDGPQHCADFRSQPKRVARKTLGLSAIRFGKASSSGRLPGFSGLITHRNRYHCRSVTKGENGDPMAQPTITPMQRAAGLSEGNANLTAIRQNRSLDPEGKSPCHRAALEKSTFPSVWYRVNQFIEN
jgi:hypothetical protein